MAQPFHLIDDSIKLIAMKDKHLLTIDGCMYHSIFYDDIAKYLRNEYPEELVMIASNVIDLSSLATFTQDLLYHIIMRLRPKKILAESPTIDQVPNKISAITFKCF